MAQLHGIDELVYSIGLYIPRSPIFYLNHLPFFLLYVVLSAVWFSYGFSNEAALTGIGICGFLQLLTVLICHWSVHFRCFMSCKATKSINLAKVVKVVPTENNGSSELVPLKNYQKDGEIVYYFLFQKIKYIWDEEKKTFRGITFPVHNTFRFYLESKGFRDEQEITSAELDYGNNMMEMVIPEFLELFRERATAPFFVFQVFCVGLWCLDEYWYYSLFTLMMLILFECTLVQQQLRNMAEVRNMGNKPYPMLVHRGGKWQELMSNQLVPGDIVSVTSSKEENLVPCDLLLLRGSCVVDESMLTGESVPQMKEPIESSELDHQLSMESDKKLHILFGGTKVLQSFESQETKTANEQRNEIRKAKDKGCVAYVLQTGFNTSQGKLLRTILFGVKRVTANNFETFAFILFLLVFAVVAAIYVWVKGCQDPTRNRYKLFLECTLILTSVVPPELPIELSLAVNTSLLSLSKLYVYCTEPFRIPFAGKIDICCFDKTGTLTKDSLVLEGIAGLNSSNPVEITPISEAPQKTIQVLASCHSLARLNNELLGDPLEKAALNAINWFLTDSNGVLPVRGDTPGLKIIHRHHFSSQLKRMSVVAGYKNIMGTEFFIGCVKGAPETLKDMFSEVPANYDETYFKISQKGARILALGFKELGKISQQNARELSRAAVESELTFAGFVVFSSPLKSDSKAVIREIIDSTHAVTMITGDSPLTACHVAKELEFTKKTILMLSYVNDEWLWRSISGEEEAKVGSSNYKDIVKKYDLCVTGEGLTYLKANDPDLFNKLLPHISVFSRVGPKQKELVIVTLKALGYCTLMCGDGTNDVGALKHADCGVAIIANAPERIPKKEKPKIKPETKPAKIKKPLEGRRKTAKDPNYVPFEEILKKVEQEEMQVVKLGDASIAAPFTSKLSSIQCICHVIKQGRCTLVTTLQMFKILALHALILAYSQSVLYLDGIKFSDFQATLQGLLLAACFLCISRSKPLKVLSKQRPLPNIFNLYTISTMVLQFAVHFICLIYLVREASLRSPKEPPANQTVVTDALEHANATSTEGTELTEETKNEFKPNLVNSTVYIISMMFQISTFAINYRGHPFMESLRENRALLHSLLGTSAIVASLALGIIPDMSEYFQIVDFPSEFRIILIQVLIADFVVSYLVDRVCMRLMGEGRIKIKR